MTFPFMAMPPEKPAIIETVQFSDKDKLSKYWEESIKKTQDKLKTDQEEIEKLKTDLLKVGISEDEKKEVQEEIDFISARVERAISALSDAQAQLELARKVEEVSERLKEFRK